MEWTTHLHYHHFQRENPIDWHAPTEKEIQILNYLNTLVTLVAHLTNLGTSGQNDIDHFIPAIIMHNSFFPLSRFSPFFLLLCQFLLSEALCPLHPITTNHALFQEVDCQPYISVHQKCSSRSNSPEIVSKMHQHVQNRFVAKKIR